MKPKSYNYKEHLGPNDHSKELIERRNQKISLSNSVDCKGAQMTGYQELIAKLTNDLPGYHLSIELFPSGGIIDASDCEECGTENSSTITWSYSGKIRGPISFDEAINKLKQSLGV